MTSTLPENLPTAFEYAMKILSKRAYAESEIRTKLYRKGYAASEIDSALENCRRYSFVNDELYASDYARLLNARGCGTILIRRKLAMLRIAEEFIDRAVAEIAEFEIEAAKNSLDFKLRMLKNEKDRYKKKQKIYAFLVSRGYSFDTIKDVLDEVEL